ncbi:MAG: hypothetical protein A2020_15730 [Lentisphaerae bacterium GWF2_45_14]|nr:MAG: hypothetical protein A2020_15730 [Lentisphaerae bacterium GWF2_45_14]
MIKTIYFKFVTAAAFFYAFSLPCHSADGDTNPSQQPAVKNQYAEEVGKDIVLREEYEISADNFFREGNDAFQKNDFQKAVDSFLKALENLRKCSDTSEYIKAKIESTDKAIARSYFYWAESIARQAEKNMKAEDFDMAIANCSEAIKVYPPCRKKMEEMLQRLEKMKKGTAYKSEIDEDTLDPDKKEREYKMDLLLKKGMTFYKDRQYDRARDIFEEVLVINPYNMTAIDSLRKTNLKLLATGEARTQTTRAERIDEDEWKMVSPILPRTLTGATESVITPVDKESTSDKIQQKLKNIVIDRIVFEDVTLPTVVKYLKQRSKQLDPEKTGVNIFLRLSTKKPAEAAPDAAVDEWGDNSTEGEKDDADTEEKDSADTDSGGESDGTSTENMSAGDVPTVTLAVENIELGAAINYICKLANVKYRVERYAVVIASNDVPLEDVETKIYPLDQEAIDKIGDDNEAVRKHFENRGILFPAGARIVYDSKISRLIATNTPDNLKKVEEIIYNELNAVDPQVLIQTKFVEIAQNDLEELGFEYYYSRSGTIDVADMGHPFDNLSNPLGPMVDGSPSPITKIGPNSTTYDVNDRTMRGVNNDGIGDITAGSRPDQMFNMVYADDRNRAFQVIVNALDQCDSADVLSTPRVTTMNGEEATIRMVTEVYYPESWTEATLAQTTGANGGLGAGVFTSSVPEFGETTELGIVLKVTPQVDADRYTITLEMNPVVKSYVGDTDYSYQVTVSGDNYTNTLTMPIIESRTVQTSVTIYDGETIVLGGIIKDRVNSYDDKIPVLGDIPIVGRAFQSKSQYSEKANLLIFLTCRLINPNGSPIREREVRGLPSFRQ